MYHFLVCLLLCILIVLSGCYVAPFNVGEATQELLPTSIIRSEVTPSPIATLYPTQAPTELSTKATQPDVQPTMQIPFPVTVSPDAWLIELSSGDIQIRFDTARWESTQFDEFIPLYYEGGPVLVHNELDGCQISLNFGGGVPMDWSLEKESLLLGDHEYSVVSFRDGDGEMQFVIYDALFRVTFGNDVDGCLQEAEVVLSSYQVSSGE